MRVIRPQVINYYKNRQLVGRIIIDHVKKKKYIVYGARSLNAHLPSHLDKHTQDYDVLVKKNPKAVAQKVERRLDKKFKGNFFMTKPAQHPGTHKVITRIGKEGVADFTQGQAPYRRIKGVRYSTLAHEKANIRKSLADKASKYRHDKDRERLMRIKLFEAMRKRKRPIRKPKIKRRKRSIGNRFDFKMPKIYFPKF